VGYVHGYGTPEQERLVSQAEHWRRPLICDGTHLEPGTRLLEVGCGVGAVLAVLGQEYPGIELTGIDIEPRQLEFARGHLRRSGVEATLIEADATALPYADASFDHVWTMWLLEHLAEPVAALREARRVLVPGGRITAIEVDYGTCFANPSTPALDALFAEVVRAMAEAGWSDAGTRLPHWLAEAGFREIDKGARPFEFRGADLETQASNAADVVESALGPREGIADLRALPGVADARLGWVMHKSAAVR
jgi:ubiquinone/menaquinone biosynthesis C-methylase UbiE